MTLSGELPEGRLLHLGAMSQAILFRLKLITEKLHKIYTVYEFECKGRRLKRKLTGMKSEYVQMTILEDG